MRYDTKIEIFNLTKIDDGLGGFSKQFELLDTVLANVSPISFEVSEKLFGKVSMTALSCIINKKISFTNNADIKVIVNEKRYSLVTFKNFRNKTLFYLEVADNVD